MARAFTLAELIVATIMMSVLIGATYLAVSQTIRSRDTSQSRGEAMSRARAAVDLIAEDAQNALRGSDLRECRVLITRDGKPGDGKDGLLLFSHLERVVRPSSTQAEGDEGEVQFRLQAGDKPDSSSLWRRSDPVIDEFPDAGGVASALVDGISSLNIQANNGTDWVDDWDSDIDGLPYAIRVTAVGTDDKGRSSITARRVIAIDRPPLPKESEDLADAAAAASEAAAAAATAAASGGGGTSAGGNTGGGGSNLGGGRAGFGRGGNGGGGRPNDGGGRGGQGGGRGGGQGGQGGAGGGPGGPGGGQGGPGRPGGGQGGGGPRGGGGGGGR